MKQVTLADVGQAANVSTALASLVLSGNYQGRCTSETADQVLAAAKHLGYRPNRVARSLRRQSTRVLGLLSIQVATTPYAGNMILAAQQRAKSFDYDLLFVEVGNSQDEIKQGFDLLAEHQVDGVLVFSYFHQEITLPSSAPKNVVIANGFSSGELYDCFVPNEFDSFMQVLAEVGHHGHKTVAFINDASGSQAGKSRAEAFASARLKFGWDTRPELTKSTLTTTANDGYLAAKQILSDFPEVTAIATFNDPLAMGVFQAAKEMGLSLPSDLSITGFDDLTLISAGLRPGLSTVALPHEQMGKQAVDRLIQVCESKDELQKERVEVMGELILRQSLTAPRTNSQVSSMASAKHI